MLLETTELDRLLEEILASNMPGKPGPPGGDAPEGEEEEQEDDEATPT
jgi:hypothetical protein